MLNELYKMVRECSDGAHLEGCLNEEEDKYAQARRNFASPDIRPGMFDITWEAWLIRLDFWGKVKISYNNPEGWGKTYPSRTEFVRHASDENLINQRGAWDTERIDINKLSLFRNYVTPKGKRVKEEYRIDIDLRPELKKALK